MLGTKMQLQDRISEGRRKLERESSLEKIRITTKDYHSYSFRFNKPYVNKTEKPPPLAIKPIEPSSELVTFNTGASLVKWCQKRPRLKSSCKKVNVPTKTTEEFEGMRLNDYRSEDNHESESKTEEFEENIDILSCERYFDDEKIYSHRFNEAKKMMDDKQQRKRMSEKRIEVNNNTIIASSFNKNPSKNRKKEKSKPRKKGKKKTVKLCLSKPAGPETIQVIRVALTSSYSYEEFDDSSIDNDYCRRFKEVLKNEDEVEEDPPEDYMLTCQKVILVPRDG